MALVVGTTLAAALEIGRSVLDTATSDKHIAALATLTREYDADPEPGPVWIGIDEHKHDTVIAVLETLIGINEDAGRSHQAKTIRACITILTENRL